MLNPYDLTTMHGRCAAPTVHLRDDLRLPFWELADFYNCSIKQAHSLYDWARVLVMHDQALAAANEILSIERNILDTYNELLATMAAV